MTIKKIKETIEIEIRLLGSIGSHIPAEADTTIYKKAQWVIAEMKELIKYSVLSEDKEKDLIERLNLYEEHLKLLKEA